MDMDPLTAECKGVLNLSVTLLQKILWFIHLEKRKLYIEV